MNDRFARDQGRREKPSGFKHYALLVLAITAFACSQAVFALFHDPEGPNLVVVTALAAVICLISAAVHISNLFPSLTGFQRILATIFIQLIVAAGFYLGLR